MLSNMPFLTGPELPVDHILSASQEEGLSPEVVTIFPMTRAQEGLWMAYTQAPHHTLYNLTMKCTFSKDKKASIDSSVSSLHNAINILTRRHVILRCTFHDANRHETRPFLAEWDQDTATPVLDIVTKPNTLQAEAKVQSLLRKAVDLSSTFAVRWIIVLKPAQTELFLVSHHIALDGRSMSQLSNEFFELLSVKKEVSIQGQNKDSEPFHKAHMLEALFKHTPDFVDAKTFWLRQSKNVRPIKWIKPTSLDDNKDYREIQTWFEFPNTELCDWGNRYQTSWFRVAVGLVGVLIRSLSEPNEGADQAVTIAFGGRPGALENTVGHFANTVPIRIPLADILSSQTPPTFEELVRLISTEISNAKKYDRLSYLDISEAHREAGLRVPPSQVAITFSPKPSHSECSLYPVEGPYDLFFCFLEGEASVKLGVIYNPLVFSDADISTLKDAFWSLRKNTFEEAPLIISDLSILKPHFPHLLTRIDFTEIERTICDTMPEISSVSVQSDEGGLCAFVAPKSIDGNFLKNVLSRRLPRYMVPSSVYSLDSLSLNRDGTIDHEAVKAIMQKIFAEGRKSNPVRLPMVVVTPPDSPPSESSYLGTPSEVQIISRIWEQLLNLSYSPSPSDNFFNLGGNSVVIQTLASRLKNDFSLKTLRAVELYSHATLIAQAELINSKRSLPFGRPWSLQSLPATPPRFFQEEDIEASVKEIWTSVLGVLDIPPEANFFDAGGNRQEVIWISIAVSSILAKFRARWPTLDVKTVDLLQYSTIKAQVALVSKCLPSFPPSPSETVLSDPLDANQPEDMSSTSFSSEIAIVGLAGRFPGASSADELFQLFLDKRDGLTTFSEPAPGRLPFKDAICVSKRGAIDGVEDFDPSRWGLNQDEAKDMDPQQRLFLEVTYEALEDSGYLPSSDEYNNIGLCVGAASDTWGLANKSVDGDDFHKAHHAILTPCISARTAYHLNLHGPNITLNTACSSGMVAMSTAINHLRSGECDTSVAGGVSIAFPQEGYVTAKHQLFSPSGHCRPFDHRADGTLPGDAVCALVLRRLEDAIRDGDKIYSIVSGIATGFDGQTEKVGCAVPSPRGQANTIIRAWKDSRLSASDLLYAELHGSGTAISDALELEGLSIARTELNAGKIPITVGSNKGSIGNCEAAGALVSVIKMCKSMQHGVIPGMSSFQKLNPMINTDLPITIATREVPLPPNAIVSVSSTGLGGVNAHCILRTPPTRPQRLLDTLHRPFPVTRTSSFLSQMSTSSTLVSSSTDDVREIAKCASDILGVKIQEDTLLHDAGLDSQGQVQLIHQLAKVLPSATLPIIAFFQPDYTPATLASHLKQLSLPTSDILPSYFTILQSGDLSVLYCLIAPGGGSCASYVDLSQHLSPSATIVALGHPDLTSSLSPPNSKKHQRSVKDLGQIYANDLIYLFKGMKECVLIGASFGGLVAVELYQQLTEEGIIVKSLSLLDSPWPTRKATSNLLKPSTIIRNLFGNMAKDALFNHLDHRVADLSPPESYDIPSQCAFILSSIHNALSCANPKDRAVIERHDWKALIPVYIENVHATRDFAISDDLHLDVPTLYVRAALTSVINRLDKWKTVFPKLNVHEVEADHASFYSGTYAKTVATLISNNTM
ncbi:hypothetical protein CPB83DRAFT_887614 [Crepidotus variabilis]|uniref:Polyketide synthase n=1 Tax=Crepidotus variabilis TaxID=179855 RepID=A0A9P6E4K2_9AGAR|nr:hypothetical protein CPB83DRAFT_887614 [Crepidotus variabilis]